MPFEIAETVKVDSYQPVHLVSYTSGGATRYVPVRDAGDNGYSTPSANPGCHTYQGRDLRAVARYAIDHSPGVRTYGHLADARSAVRRMIEGG